jgi:hypothetical protein
MTPDTHGIQHTVSGEWDNARQPHNTQEACNPWQTDIRKRCGPKDFGPPPPPPSPILPMHTHTSHTRDEQPIFSPRQGLTSSRHTSMGLPIVAMPKDTRRFMPPAHAWHREAPPTPTGEQTKTARACHREAPPTPTGEETTLCGRNNLCIECLCIECLCIECFCIECLCIECFCRLRAHASHT